MVHPTSLISPKAKIGKNVTIGPFCIIHDNVEIGDNVRVESHCELGIETKLGNGQPLRIAAGSLIRSHSVFYESSSFGEGLVTGHRVTVRELTFAGKNLQLGTLTDVQGHCTIGDYVRMHSNVHIGQKSTIGNFVWIFPYVVLTNDPHPPSNILKGCTIEDYSVIATMAVLLPGVTVANHALVGAHSLVSKDVSAHTVVAGAPAKPICKTEAIKLQDGSGLPAYPWTTHFRRGYPEDVVKNWK
jgi:acetyltransferase-like isoleucine patch superfamily enzyme